MIKNTYITHSQLGEQGRFGNQLFQVAFLLGMFGRLNQIFGSNQRIFIPLYGENMKTRSIYEVLSYGCKNFTQTNRFFLYKPFPTHHIASKFQFSESSFSYNELFLDYSNYLEYEKNDLVAREGYAPNYVEEHCLNIIEYTGYYQSPKYFNHCAKEIAKFYTNPELIAKYSGLGRLYNIDTIEKYSNHITCAVHIRRTDYINDAGIHHNIDVDKYFDTMAELAGELSHPVLFIIYSDDIEWCRQQFSNYRDNSEFHYLFETAFRVPYYDSELYDFYSMINDTDHIICANSSFSWWAGWLKKQLKPWAQVFLPDKWFKDNGPKDTQDLYYEGSRTYIS